MKRMLFIAPLLCLLLAGCPKNQTPYGIAAKLGDDIGTAVNAGSTATDQMRISGTLSADDERSVLAYFSTVNTLNATYLSCVAGAHSSGDSVAAFESCGGTFLTAAQNPATLAAIHVTNPASQASVMAKVAAVQTIIQAAETTLAGFGVK